MQEGHPIAFESRKVLPAEKDYDVADKKLNAFKIWRHSQKGSHALL